MDKPNEFHIKGIDIKYQTKPGVFSSHGVDDGTRLLLENIVIKDESLVADLGGGAGIISLYIAKINWRGHIHLLDDHLRSVELAKQNVELNNIKNVEIYLSDLFSAVEKRTYNQIVSNPPQQLGNVFLLELIEQSKKHLKPKGEFWLVVKKNVKPVMERFLTQVFGNLELVASGREHIVLRAVND